MSIDKIILSPTYAFKKQISGVDYDDLRNAILKSPEIIFNYDPNMDNAHTTGDRIFPHENKSASQLKKEIILFAEEVLQKDYKIADIWAVCLEKGQATSYHRHSSNSHMFPQEYWSGVVYVSAPEDSARLCLYAQVCNTVEFVEKIQPQQGLAVLFNSYVPHQTERHQGSISRICVSFNLEPCLPNKNLVPDMTPWKNNFD